MSLKANKILFLILMIIIISIKCEKKDVFCDEIIKCKINFECKIENEKCLHKPLFPLNFPDWLLAISILLVNFMFSPICIQGKIKI